jgi:hypothetical protein
VSLLTACQAVVKETGIGTAPSTIISNTDPSAVQLNALAERSAKSLMGYNWQAMIREQTITTVASTETYSLPSDWDRYISETAWDATSYWQMRGQLTAQMWQAYKRGIVTLVTAQKMFRLRGNLIYIIPTPTAVESLIIEYLRNTPWTDSTGVTYRVAATADTDKTVFSENLLVLDMKWRYKAAKGLPYDEEKAEAEDEINLAVAQDTPAPIVNYGKSTGGNPPFYPNVPQTIV